MGTIPVESNTSVRECWLPAHLYVAHVRRFQLRSVSRLRSLTVQGEHLVIEAMLYLLGGRRSDTMDPHDMVVAKSPFEGGHIWEAMVYTP